MNQAQLPRSEFTDYLRQLATRIDQGEEIKVTLLVDANGRTACYNHGHKNVGEMVLQISDNLFVQRLAFVLPQLLPQVIEQLNTLPHGSTH